MKKYRFQIALLVLALLVILFLRGWPRKIAPSPTDSEANSIATNKAQIEASASSPPGSEQRVQKSATIAKVPAANDSTVSEAVKEYVRKSMADPGYDWKQPIDFYGKVVDENNVPVASANVDYTWSTILSETGTSTRHSTADAAGMFFIHETGKGIGITVSKEGYYTTQSERLRNYEYANPAIGLHIPDPNNPIVFHLRKKGETEPLVVLKRNYRIPKDGTSVGIDLATGKKVAAEQESIKIECWTSAERNRENGNRYDWKCVLSVPGGGLTDSTNEFDFTAPTEGYRALDEINMPQTLAERWSSDVARSYILKLGNGDYAYLKFRMIAGGDHFCIIESHLNPSGSRNLELDPDKIIIAQ